jgi:hypothetical protein
VIDPDNHVHLVLERKLARLARADIGLRFIVLEDELDLPPENSAVRVAMLDGELGALLQHFAPDTHNSGERSDRAHLHGFRGARNAAAKQT